MWKGFRSGALFEETTSALDWYNKEKLEMADHGANPRPSESEPMLYHLVTIAC